MKYKQNSYRWISILLLVSIIVFISMIFVIFIPSSKNDVPYADIRKAFAVTQIVNGGNVTETRDAAIWWITPDGYNIIIRNVPSIQLYTYNCQTDIETQSAFTGIAQTLSSSINAIMGVYGFTKNELNSSSSLQDKRLYDYVQAYEKGETKCVFVANPDCATYSADPMHYTYSFSCTDTLDQQYREQQPILQDLSISDAVIFKQHSDENFTVFGVNDRRSGYSLIATYQDGKWVEIFAGQDLPPCTLMEQYHVPKTIVPDCYQPTP